MWRHSRVGGNPQALLHAGIDSRLRGNDGDKCLGLDWRQAGIFQRQRIVRALRTGQALSP